MNQLFVTGAQNIGASASVFPMNIQGWFLFELTDLLAVQGTLKSLLQPHSSKPSILWHSAFFTVQLSHPNMITGKATALTRWTFADKVMSLLFNMLSRLVITFLPRSKRLLISWLQSTWIVTIKMVVLVLYNNGNNFIPKLFYDIGTVWFKGTMMRNYGYIKIYCPSFSLSLYAIYNRLYLNKV